MSVQAQRRWNWINGFLTASLNASIEYLGLPVSGLTFADFIGEYVHTVQGQLQNFSRLPRFSFAQADLKYVFHLESELWGIDYECYEKFFQSSSSNPHNLQTFKFVLAFFIIERCLHLFVPHSQKQLRRKGRRQHLFGYKNGLFSVRYPALLEAMGPPFFLKANRQCVLAIGNAGQIWDSLRQVSIPSQLQSFYQMISGGRHVHFSTIIEAAFINTRKKHLVGRLRKSNRPLPLQTRAWWYDVLWKYSESIRYHALIPSRQSLSQPFFWNRSIRWFTSLAVTGLLQILAASNPIVNQTWRSTLSSNRILSQVFRGCSRI